MVKNHVRTLPQDIERGPARRSAHLAGLLLHHSAPGETVLQRRRAVRLRCWRGTSFSGAPLFTSNLAAQTLLVTIAGFTVGRATDDGLVAAHTGRIPPLLIAIGYKNAGQRPH
ncbi:hypothetical protein LNP25_28125 [Klebsiella variicola subsp. variicola]|nr:hypothetical protein [Klebsiella variicola subsp. variicola]